MQTLKMLLTILLMGAALSSSAAQAESAARLKAGDIAPSFKLRDLGGKEWDLAEAGKGKIVILEWVSPECPISTAYHSAAEGAELGFLEDSYAQIAGEDLLWLSINSIGADAEGNSLDDNLRFYTGSQTPYPMLLDSDFAVAGAYGARSTPDIFIIDQNGLIAYSGAVDADADDTHPDGINYIVEAVTALRSGVKPAICETEPYGCPL